MRFSDLRGTRVGVWGAGREIRSFAAQLQRRIPSAQIAVIAVDSAADFDLRKALAAPSARVVSGGNVVPSLAACDIVVRSPGVSIYRDELLELRARGVPITTATSLWLAEVGGANVIGITGTKGKSTTASLIAHLALAAGSKAELAGNIGSPALDLLDRPSTELSVIELSSYQIADLEVGPQVVVLTNLHREHIDWHRSEQRYFADKLRLLALPGVRMAAINGRDRRLVEAVHGMSGHRLYGVPGAWDVTDAGVVLAGQLMLRAEEMPLLGAHNALNLCAALTGLELVGLARPPLPEALQGVTALPHRLELVAEQDGVRWVDDSISTTPESTLAALASFPDCEVILLAGGQDREQEYSDLGQVLAERKAVVLGLPVTGSRVIAAARRAGAPESHTIAAENMESAVSCARAIARPGTTVLLSPAAPSYNTYLNFEERAQHFRDLL